MYYLIWAPIKAIALILLYMPPRHVSMTSIVSTYVVWALLHGLFPLGIPWMALGAEVSQDNIDKLTDVQLLRDEVEQFASQFEMIG